MQPPIPREIVPFVVLGLLLLPALACGPSATPASAQPTVASLAVEQPTSAVVVLTEPTKAALPTPVPVPSAEPLRLAGQGFGQDGRQVGYAFLVENPNTTAAVENSRYQVAFFGADGTVVGTDSGYLEVVLPGQRLGIAGTSFVDEGVGVTGIEAQLSSGDTVASDPLPVFGVEAVTYQAGDYAAYARGIISNPFNRAMSNLRVAAVVYDAAGAIIGGGYTYANFILANSARGVEMSVTSLPSVSRVEIYPTLSGLSDLSAPEAQPDGAVPLALLRQGYGQDQTQLAYGLVLQNPNPAHSIERSQYHATAYAADARVLGVEEGYIELVLPGQTLGIAGDTYLDSPEPVARLDVQLQVDEFVPSEPLPGFTAENIAHLPVDDRDSLTGQIVNPYACDISNLRVAAILYDANGIIVGGGYTYLDFVPANGRAAVDVSVVASGVPAGGVDSSHRLLRPDHVDGRPAVAGAQLAHLIVSPALDPACRQGAGVRAAGSDCAGTAAEPDHLYWHHTQLGFITRRAIPELSGVITAPALHPACGGQCTRVTTAGGYRHHGGRRLRPGHHPRGV